MNLVTLYTTYIHVTPNSALPEFDMMRAVGFIMGIVIVVLGNYMPKTRNNRNIGFRLPWTRYNDTTWRKSNKFASYVMMIVGAISIIGSIFLKGTVSILIMLVSLILAILIISVYAYLVYKKEKNV